MPKKIVYDKIKELSIEEMSNFIADILALVLESLGFEEIEEQYEDLCECVEEYLTSDYIEPSEFMS